MFLDFHKNNKLNIFSLFILLLTGCETTQRLNLKPVAFHELPNFNNDDLSQAYPAMVKTCKRLGDLGTVPLKTGPDGSGNASDWRPFCHELLRLKQPNTPYIKQLIQKHLHAYLAYDDNKTGHFTGYYEPLLHGSFKRHGKYQTPLYKFPGSKGYIPRSEIVRGALSGKGLELLYVSDPVSAFFVQIQGSGQVRLPNGKMIRIGYDGANKHKYVPIGKTLIDMGELQRGKATMQSIRHWLKTHPRKAEQVMSSNPSYVYFRILKNSDGPIGAHKVSLTPQRSLAIDPKYISLGSLMWLDATNPDCQKSERLQRLMVAQDIGGAIKGPLRADFFWGHGVYAENMAGLMNATGNYYLLLPR